MKQNNILEYLPNIRDNIDGQTPLEENLPRKKRKQRMKLYVSFNFRWFVTEKMLIFHGRTYCVLDQDTRVKRSIAIPKGERILIDKKGNFNSKCLDNLPLKDWIS